jgi:hypothetical protein
MVTGKCIGSHCRVSFDGAAGKWEHLSRGDGDVEARGKDEGSAKEHVKAGLVTPDEIGDERASDELGVVVLRDVGSGGMFDGNVEAEGSEGAEKSHGEESRGEADGEWGGVNEDHQGETDDCGDDAGEEGEALGGFGLGEDAGPHHVGGEAGDANDAGGEADPVAIVCAGPGMHGDDDSGESRNDRHGLLPGQTLAQEDAGEQRDHHGGHEDEDVEEGEGKMPERDDNADIVCHVEAGAGDLAAEPVRAQNIGLAARKSVYGEKDGHEEAEEGDHLVGRKSGLADELDGGIGEHPEGETREREANCLEI